ncbi:MAG: site-specific integrase [Thermoleophilaceae bacterium]|nr:site-specific integrase [Thermoleophilaceae bacterium]
MSSVVTLARDALEIGTDGHTYLRYRNVKLRREAFCCPRPRRAGEGLRAAATNHHPSHTMTRQIVKRYVRKAEIRDGEGRLATWVHPHLFRHHLGTSMVNDGVPLPVIQKVLDHASPEMTARYAQLHDETLRREIARWHERVNIRGERVALPAEGPLGQAAWMKERIARARQALPNGYCGLPLVQTWPHPNACLSCDNFLTDPSFRPVHQQQLANTSELRERAERQGSLRLVEVLERDERSLTRILTGLDQIEADHQDDATELDVVELAVRHPATRSDAACVKDGNGLRAAAAARTLGAIPGRNWNPGSKEAQGRILSVPTCIARLARGGPDEHGGFPPSMRPSNRASSAKIGPSLDRQVPIKARPPARERPCFQDSSPIAGDRYKPISDLAVAVEWVVTGAR